LKEDIKILKGIVMDMHGGAYTYNKPQDLAACFDSVSNSINENLTTRLFFQKIDFLVDKLRCIHTSAYFPKELYDSISNREIFFPTPLILLSNKLFVNTNMQNIPLGAEILSINGMNASVIIKRIKRHEHKDGYNLEERSESIDYSFPFNFYLEFGGFKKFDIEYLPDSSKTSTLETYSAEKLNTLYDNEDFSPYLSIPLDVNYNLQMLDGGKTALFSIRTFHLVSNNAKESFCNFLDNSFQLIKQKGTENVIIDCRDNSGGFYDMTYSFLSYLVDKKMPEYDSSFQRFKHLTYTKYVALEDTIKIKDEDTAYLKYTKIDKKLYKLKPEEIEVWAPNKYLFKGNIYVIVNSYVASAASTFAAVLQDKTNAILFGEETGGSNNEHNADIIKFELPYSKIKIDIPLRKYYQPILHVIKGRGVIPNKKFTISQRDLIDGKDEPLDYILDSIIKKR
jgi:Peptidase family S41